ncbi:Lysine histidine transporter-like 8 [Capsicum annuum]|uniref:Lysine histidine transporter-like 8 n=1 Tax=Capsicum annuum TaxID=4072 RepID=A0A2G2ZSR8_CAPAN|nr:Lysine histidine transporter-like 8 [Capsicum annuum]
MAPHNVLDSNNNIPKTPKSPFSSKILMSPLPSPMKKALTYMEEIGNLTKLNDPQDDWLPITESRSGNAYYAAFHTLSSGIGVQVLLLPLAFVTLGCMVSDCRIWGIISLSLVFIWQLYTLWLLIQLHESAPGLRYSPYLHLSMAAFGEKLGKILALLPTMYLSGGTCVTLIIIGGSSTMKILFQTVGASNSHIIIPLSTIEWYLVFTLSAIVLAQLPNLNSISGSFSHRFALRCDLLYYNMGNFHCKRKATRCYI